jgi:hypothetical protein
MRVYGDRARSAFAGEALDALADRIAEISALPPGLARHADLVGALVQAASLHQGVADLELTQHGVDDDTAAQRAGFDVLRRLARGVAASWYDPSGPLDLDINKALARWRDVAPAERLSLRVAEGFAHYAVYPEAYLEAARSMEWPTSPQIVGLRSIGVALAAMVAAAFEAGPAIAALRPVGEPFTRRLTLGEDLRTRLLDHAGLYAAVDEGPGLSGSSFGAVGDFLASAGVAANQVVYLPSHGGSPGPMVSSDHRERWARSRRLVADFDSRIGAARLEAWASEALGPLIAPLRDISGGAWRTSSVAPVIPMLERRKFLAETATGPWLLKFAGLGAEGENKAERARALAAAGFSPEVGGLLHGFLAQRWIAETRPFQPAQWSRGRLLDHLADYLSFRARRFPAHHDEGADLPALADMARVNAAEALGESVGDEVARRLQTLLADAPLSRPVHVDSRLHAWEWLVTPTGDLLKIDAVDHSCGHDLVGCQDIAWDVAGAELELGLSSAETERLARRLGVVPGMLAIQRACYPAFQLGLWSFAPAEEAPRVQAHVRRYREALRRFAEPSTLSGEDPWMEPRRRAT